MFFFIFVLVFFFGGGGRGGGSTHVRAAMDSDDEIFLTQNTPVGHNKLGNVVSKMCKDAALQGQLSNPSLRATTGTHGLEKRNLR